MIRRAWVFFVISSLWISVGFAQGTVGGPKKNQNYLGGPTAQSNPVVPPRRGEIAGTGGATLKKPKR